MTPTPEQLAIIEAATSTSSNLIISALAGAAKTSTLVLLAKALRTKSILCLAFNKKIAVEMQERLPPNCTASTLSSAGYQAWRGFVRSVKLVDGKTLFIFKDWLQSEIAQTEHDTWWELWPDIRDAISYAKSRGFVPADKRVRNLVSILDEHDFWNNLEVEHDEDTRACIIECLLRSIEQAWAGRIDFDDMLYMPTLCPSTTFPQQQVVFVDEAQDLSILNHYMLKKLLRGNTRLIATGDPNQSIYAFRGADEHSMGQLEKNFNMTPLSLTVSFRCPIRVVEEARWRAPNMQYPDPAKTGTVTHFNAWDTTGIPAGAAIICRNNAPLFKCALEFLKRRRPVDLGGNPLLKSLRTTMTKFGSASMPEEEALIAVELWRDEQMKKTKKPEKIADTYECFLVFLRDAGTLGNAIAALDELMTSSGTIRLMTGHKSKGLEFNDVFILDAHLVRVTLNNAPISSTPSHLWNLQEANLLYVMQTRAKETLSYITSDTYIPPA